MRQPIFWCVLFSLNGTAASFAAEDPDWRLEARVRQAIHDHTELTRLHPGVTVQNGTASLFGQLPSKKLHEELLRTVRDVKGVHGVASRVRIVPPPDTLPDQIAAAVLGKTPFASENRLPTREEAPALVRERTRSQTPAETVSASSRTAMKPDATPQVNLDEAIRLITRNDLRYRKVSWEIVDGVVKLRGQVEYKQDAWDLADRLADLPGVRRVQLDGIGR